MTTEVKLTRNVRVVSTALGSFKRFSSSATTWGDLLSDFPELNDILPGDDNSYKIFIRNTRCWVEGLDSTLPPVNPDEELILMITPKKTKAGVTSAFDEEYLQELQDVSSKRILRMAELNHLVAKKLEESANFQEILKDNENAPEVEKQTKYSGTSEDVPEEKDTSYFKSVSEKKVKVNKVVKPVKKITKKVDSPHSSLTRKELFDRCSKLGISVPFNTKNVDLIKILDDALVDSEATVEAEKKAKIKVKSNVSDEELLREGKDLKFDM